MVLCAFAAFVITLSWGMLACHLADREARAKSARSGVQIRRVTTVEVWVEPLPQ
jgi:hypothetical protein